LELLHDKDDVTDITMDHKTEQCEGVTKKTFLDSTQQHGVQHDQDPTQRRQDRVEGKRFFSITTVINGTTSIKKNDAPLSSRNHTKKLNKRVSTETGNTKFTSAVQQKVLILGDSHLTGSTVKVRNMLSSKFEATGVIKPGAAAEKIGDTSTNDLHNLTTRDVIVLNTGANDLYKNNKDTALAQIVKFIQNNYNTNIIVMSIPHRYNLSFSSYVNSEIQKFNRRLNEMLTYIIMLHYYKLFSKQNSSLGMECI
jgi:hypothetical protein